MQFHIDALVANNIPIDYRYSLICFDNLHIEIPVDSER